MGSICKESEYDLEKAELITEPRNRNKIFLKKNSAKFTKTQDVSEVYEEEKSKSNDKSLSGNFFRLRNNSTKLPKSSSARKFLSFDLPMSNTNKKVISKLSAEKFNELFGNDDYFSPKINNKNRIKIKDGLLGNPTINNGIQGFRLNTCANGINNFEFDNINEIQGKKVNLV